MEIKASDSLGRYYTDQAVACLLIESMRVFYPESVVDLGSGSGMLVRQAAKRWTSAKFLTVDIDKRANSRTLPALRGEAFSHFTGDALDYRLNERLGVDWGKTCAAVCNPPYIRPLWRKHFGQILEHVGLSDILPQAKDAPADILFIAQNLRLLKVGGKLGLIVPDGLISGERYASFRRSLMTKNSIECVIELPRNIFRKTEAQAHILVVKKGGTTTSVESRKLTDEGMLSAPIHLDSGEAEVRLDHSYHASTRLQVRGKRRPNADLGSMILSMRRGSFSSSQRLKASAPIFHTTDFAQHSVLVPRRFLVSKRRAALVGGTFAKIGDIVLARVGRNLSLKIAKVKHGVVVVSDCIWVLEPLPGEEEILLEKLTSTEGRALLNAAAHGVGARFLTASSLLKIRF